MLIELLRPCGAELARRWVAALLLVPAEEREAVVLAIESRIARVYADPADDEPAGHADTPDMHVAQEPVQRDGYTEQEIRTYRAAVAQPEDKQSDTRATGA